jgi:hypothetical protein
MRPRGGPGLAVAGLFCGGAGPGGRHGDGAGRAGLGAGAAETAYETGRGGRGGRLLAAAWLEARPGLAFWGA